MINIGKEILEYTDDIEEVVPAVIFEKNRCFCNRCGNYEEKSFYLDELGVYCLKCLKFEKSTNYKLIHRKKIKIAFNEDICLNKKIFCQKCRKKRRLRV